ncbi:Piso0_002167 [Millerozyma farinosa CBS 7064]|uniref:Piso0_002167 protein n=1 Tax=Pichia sorbitophila (strain ATCC MYA-4447 / BCRC 22081 / CBS 7064 / NBRC 10061 / NRRL Y-12695) TaxID=559304 RepID=G8YEB0_PICSO|nr:Piso0_002167 [Millerozyma farinosa CBS 7064]
MLGKNCVLILIGGGHAAGKYTAAKQLGDEIEKNISGIKNNIHLIDLKSYEDNRHGSVCKENFSASESSHVDPEKEHLRPSRFNFQLLKQDIAQICQSGKEDDDKIVIVHGLYALYDKELRDMSHMKVFITADPDTRLIRWIRRDVLKEGQPLSAVISAYLNGARSEMRDFIFPTREFADVIMPRGAEPNAIKLIVDGITPLFKSSKSLLEELAGPGTSNHLRPSGERFDRQKGEFYELN